MEVFEDVSSPEPEEHKLVELKKFSRREIIIKRGIDLRPPSSAMRLPKKFPSKTSALLYIPHSTIFERLLIKKIVIKTRRAIREIRLFLNAI